MAKVGGDIVQNKKTFLLIKAMELATGQRRKQLIRLLTQTEIDEQEKIKAVLNIYDELEVKKLEIKQNNGSKNHTS